MMEGPMSLAEAKEAYGENLVISGCGTVVKNLEGDVRVIHDATEKVDLEKMCVEGKTSWPLLNPVTQPGPGVDQTAMNLFAENAAGGRYGHEMAVNMYHADFMPFGQVVAFTAGPARSMRRVMYIQKGSGFP